MRELGRLGLLYHFTTLARQKEKRVVEDGRSGWQRSNSNNSLMDMKRPLMLGKIEGRRRRGDRG